jgi:hypothetical protein
MTKTIPIVAFGPDIVAEGFAESFAHPTSNVTGVIFAVGRQRKGDANCRTAFELVVECYPAANCSAIQPAESRHSLHSQHKEFGLDVLAARGIAAGISQLFAQLALISAGRIMLAVSMVKSHLQTRL